MRLLYPVRFVLGWCLIVLAYLGILLAFGAFLLAEAVIP